MTTAITTRSTKGSALTFTEMDTNFDTLAIQSLWVPVNAMRPSSSNGCALVTTVETTATTMPKFFLLFIMSTSASANA